MSQLVDPHVSREKFGRELAAYRAAERHHASRGWWLMWAEFPRMLFAFVATNATPPTIAFGVMLDFTNYDVWAPSVRIVNPFTEVPYANGEVPVPFARRVSPVGESEQAVALVQAHAGGIPFICLPGIREYHQHPAHNGDHWLLIRDTAAGKFIAILESLYKYGAAPINGLQVQIQFRIAGFTQREPEA